MDHVKALKRTGVNVVKMFFSPFISTTRPPLDNFTSCLHAGCFQNVLFLA